MTGSAIKRVEWIEGRGMWESPEKFLLDWFYGYLSLDSNMNDFPLQFKEEYYFLFKIYCN